MNSYYQKLSNRLKELTDKVKAPELAKFEQMQISKEVSKILDEYTREVKKSGKKLNDDIFFEYKEKINAFFEFRKRQYEAFLASKKNIVQELLNEHKLNLPSASQHINDLFPNWDETDDPKIISIFDYNDCEEDELNKGNTTLEENRDFKESLRELMTQLERQLKDNKKVEKTKPRVIPIQKNLRKN